MKKFLLAGIAAAAFYGAPAIAAEMPLKAAPLLLFDWTGWYVGGNGGYSWGRSTDKYHDTPVLTTEFSTSARHRGWEGSVEGGYNYQTGNKVFGVELRTDFGRECGRSSTTDPSTILSTSPAVLSTRQCVDPFLLGPHIGILTDANHMLWYVAGGLAAGEVSGTATFTRTLGAISSTSSASKWEAGYFFGLGIERMIDTHWSWKLEYDYVRLGGGGPTAALSPALTGAFAGAAVTHAGNANDNVISVGINYHFTTH